MDTITHALSGALLARALSPSPAAPPSDTEQRWFGPRVPVWQAVGLGFVAAAFPDSDVVLKWVSDLAYLRGHRGVTHSLLMLPFWALLLGALAALVYRRRAAWRRYTWLAGAAIAIHIAGDWITQFGTMLLAPFSDTRFGLGSTFIIDLVLTGILLAGLAVSALWRRSRVPAYLALALLPVWIGVNLQGKAEAIAAARDHAQRQGIAVVSVDAAPRPASPFNWTAIVFDGERYHVAHLNTRRTAPLAAAPEDNFIRRLSAPYLPVAQAQWQQLPRFGDAAVQRLAREAWAHPDFAFFRWFAMFPLVDGVEQRAGEACVWFRDLRFGFPGRDTVPFRYGMCRNGTGDWTRYASDSIAGRAALR